MMLAQRIIQKDLSFYLFTDDAEWAASIFENMENMYFVSSDKMNYMEEFFLMKQCKHFIIPESTFGQWAF